MAIPFHFAFPDGVLHYDCAQCTALCCLGHGVGAHRRELVPLLRKAPELSSWATTRNRELVYFQSPVGRCYFLNARDRCSVEEDLGRELKPSMCKAFPFNRVSLLGEVRVVTPNFLCPLRLEAASSVNAGQHAKLAAELEQVGWLEQDFPQLQLHEGESAKAFLEAEITLRAACSAALASGATLASICEEDVSEPATLLACADAETARFEAMFVALAPVWSCELSHVPRLARLRALCLARLHISRALGLAGARQTLQVAHALFDAHAPLYELLAQPQLPMPAGLLIDSGDGPTLLAAAVIDRLARMGASVGEAVREGCEGLSELDRQTLLSSLGRARRKRAR
jgi:Fe-S-cluster containining protein